MKRLKLWLSCLGLCVGVFALSGVVVFAEEAPAGEGAAASATLEQVAEPAAEPAPAAPVPSPTPEPPAPAPAAPVADEATVAETEAPVADAAPAAEGTSTDVATGVLTGLSALQNGALPTPEETPVALDSPEEALPVATEGLSGEGEELAAEGDGERNVNGQWFYYENGQAVTGWKALEDGRLVYYNADGTMHFGERNMDDGKWYYFNPGNGGWNGGWQNFDGRDLYYDWETGMHFGWFASPDERLVYFDDGNGNMTRGERKMDDGKWYYFSPEDGALQGGWQNFDGRTLYYDWEHGLHFGSFTVDNITYYGSVSNGDLLRGWQRFSNGATYYFDPESGAMAQGWRPVDNTWYLFGPGGAYSGFNTTADPNLGYEVLDLVNAERAAVGAAPLSMDLGLMALAVERAIESVTKFDHYRPDGSYFTSIFTEYGYVNLWSAVGENLSWGRRNPTEVVTAWMNSEGHKNNILRSNYTDIGVGVYMTSNGTLYWCQLFAERRAE